MAEWCRNWRKAALEPAGRLVSAIDDHQVPARGQQCRQRGQHLRRKALVFAWHAGLDPGRGVRRRPTAEVLDSNRRQALPTDSEDRVALLWEAAGANLHEAQGPARGGSAVERFQGHLDRGAQSAVG